MKMNRFIQAAVAAFALAAAVFFGVLAGGPFMQVLSGPTALTGSFEDAEGDYVTYEAVHPVASYGVESYSGDPDRISKWGYVMYDEERQAFLNVVVSDRKHSSFHHLMRDANQITADNSRPEVTPILVNGTLTLMDDVQVDMLFDALLGEDSKTTDQMNELAFAQEKWYSIEAQTAGGLSMLDVWITITAAVLNALICLFALAGLAKGEKGRAKKRRKLSDNKLDELLALQRPWLEQWNAKMKAKQNRYALASGILGAAILTGIGFATKYSVKEIMTRHLPLGLVIGEAFGILLWVGQKVRLNTEKNIDSFRKNIQKALPNQGLQEEFAADILREGPQNSFREKGSEEMCCVTVGQRFWLALHSSGAVTIVDGNQVQRVETETVSGQIRSGKVRVSFVNYQARIYLKNSKRKKGCDASFVFQCEETTGFLVSQIRKHMGDAIEIQTV